MEGVSRGCNSPTTYSLPSPSSPSTPSSPPRPAVTLHVHASPLPQSGGRDRGAHGCSTRDRQLSAVTSLARKHILCSRSSSQNPHFPLARFLTPLEHLTPSDQ
ncbi:hypothetical protein O3P69_004216 [Scylla paramamosain]|uniref:Uncharacterized protein n=1 Tax=Scylla paramamosain TaxID=85552 RepID=A0AAW0UFL7_SCYPA